MAKMTCKRECTCQPDNLIFSLIRKSRAAASKIPPYLLVDSHYQGRQYLKTIFKKALETLE